MCTDYMTMPAIPTILYIKKGTIVQKIIIYEDCDHYSLNYLEEPSHVKEFISFVRQILKDIPEIKDAPKSDLIIM